MVRLPVLDASGVAPGTGAVTDLFAPALIERLVGATDGDAIEVPHGAEARWSRDSTGRLWVRKRESFTGYNGLLAEAICHLLGGELGVRQPNAAVLHDGVEWSWMSEAVPAVRHWSPAFADLIDNPDEVAHMLALDAVTLNDDRHAANILAQPKDDHAHYVLWAIDSGNALVGQPADLLRAGLDHPNPRNHAVGLPVDALRASAMAAAEVAGTIPEERLLHIVSEACGLAREPRVPAIADALIQRCRHAPQIVASYVDALGAHS